MEKFLKHMNNKVDSYEAKSLYFKNMSGSGFKRHI